jgi:hypothetical protein
VLVPYPFSRAPGFGLVHANRDVVLETEWYYAGTVLMGFAYLSLGALFAYRWNRRWLGDNPWMISALCLLGIGFAQGGGIWQLVNRLPVLRILAHHPHRSLPFFIVAGLVTGGLFLERVLRRAQGVPTSRDWGPWIAVLVAVLMLYHVSLARNSLFCYADRPYATLPPELSQRLISPEDSGAQRFYYHGPDRTCLPGFVYGVPLSLAAVYKAYSFSGYDPVNENRPEMLAAMRRLKEDPIAACRAYGIARLIVANPDYYQADKDFWWSNGRRMWQEGFMDDGIPAYDQALIRSAHSSFRREESTVYDLAEPCPMAFDEAHADAALPIRVRGQGLDIDVPGPGEHSLVVNILFRRWLTVRGEGQPLAPRADSWGRLKVTVPEGVRHVEVRYVMGWGRGIALGLGLAVFTLAGCAVVRRLS